MLTHVVVEFPSSAERFEDLRLALVDYRNILFAYGFLATKGHSYYEDRREPRSYVGGVLCHETALEDIHAHPRGARVWARIEAAITGEPIVRRSYVPYGDDDYYCTHDDWESLTLICDYRCGLSPVVCNQCRGQVARYRLGSGDVEGLYRWDLQYAHLESLSMIVSEYEDWADDELSNVDSEINRLGISLAASMASAIGCEVLCFLATNEEQTHTQCPRCNGPLESRSLIPAWDACCRTCGIATSGEASA